MILLIFDFDDTLIDNTNLDIDSFNYISKKYKLKKIEKERIIKWRKKGMLAKNILKHLLKNKKNPKLSDCIKTRLKYLGNGGGGIKLVIEKKDTLITLKEIKTKNNIITVVTSRKNKFLVLKILKKLHFKPFIDNVYCATDCKKNNFPIQNNIKLKKCLYQLAINDNSVQAKEKTIVIGNLTEDIIAAKNLKVIPVAVRGSYRYDFGISRLSDTIRELPEILKFL